MNQEKIGKLIAECRKAKKITQLELANMLGVTDKSVSKWENGVCLPDVSLYREICRILDITLNEFFAGERLPDAAFKEVADNNLFSALENSIFTLKDKINYFKSKWKKEHLSKIILSFISWIVLIVALNYQKVDLYLICTIAGLLACIFYIALYNQMMRYIETHAYGKESKISVNDFRLSVQRMSELKEEISKFPSKEEAIKFLMQETGLSKKECSDAYDVTVKIDFTKVK